MLTGRDQPDMMTCMNENKPNSFNWRLIINAIEIKGE